MEQCLGERKFQIQYMFCLFNKTVIKFSPFNIIYRSPPGIDATAFKSAATVDGYEPAKLAIL